jgi:hypothetical protein
MSVVSDGLLNLIKMEKLKLKLKLKDLKYEIPGVESSRPAKQVLTAVLIGPVFFILIIITMMFGDMLDRAKPWHAAAMIISFCVATASFAYALKNKLK